MKKLCYHARVNAEVLTMNRPSEHERRFADALLALDGLSVGDAFGQQFFVPGMREWCFSNKTAPPPRWNYTDDTEMAIAIVEVIECVERIDQDALARTFARRFAAEPNRGYGPAARRILSAISSGSHWQEASRSVFEGHGSLGNGAAMRVAPLGAYLAGDLDRVVAQAVASAEITHGHPDGVAGAIAVAVATAWCCSQRLAGAEMIANDLFVTVLRHTPESPTRRGIEQAAAIPLDEWEYTAANLLGNGSRITSADTVPFCLWSAARSLDNFEQAIWNTVRVEGDMDTNCAIVGGIVAAAAGRDSIPQNWLHAREPLFLHSDRKNHYDH
jgi:ADP-ribosylglycohydrolase